MNMADSLDVLKAELTQKIVPQILDLLTASAAQERPLHDVEQGLWDLLLQVGRRALEAFLAGHGSGDLGETLTLPDGREVHRLQELHARPYVSVFGRFTLQRAVYGSREGQALEFVPLDNRLRLPAGAFSYLLQDWDQALVMEQPFGQASQTVARILKLKQSVDSLEGMNRQQALDVASFRDLQGSPPAAEEGRIVVVTAGRKRDIREWFRRRSWGWRGEKGPRVRNYEKGRIAIDKLPVKEFGSRTWEVIMTATDTDRGSGPRAMLHLAFELGWTKWKLAFSTGPAQKPRLRGIKARDLAALRVEIAKAKERFGLPGDAPVVSCYEAGRDGFWGGGGGRWGTS